MAGRSIVLEAGTDAALAGAADWCQGCDTLRYRRDMRWDVVPWVYRCRVCLPEAKPPRDPVTDEEAELIAAAWGL